MKNENDNDRNTERRAMRGSTSDITKTLIMEMMEDRQERSLLQIREALAENGWIYGEDYQQSHLAGVMNELVKKGELQRTGRGVYSKTKTVPGYTDWEISRSESREKDAGENAEMERIKNALLPDMKNLYEKICKEFDENTLNSIETLDDLEKIRGLLGLKTRLKEMITVYEP